MLKLYESDSILPSISKCPSCIVICGSCPSGNPILTQLFFAAKLNSSNGEDNETGVAGRFVLGGTAAKEVKPEDQSGETDKCSRVQCDAHFG